VYLREQHFVGDAVERGEHAALQATQPQPMPWVARQRATEFHDVELTLADDCRVGLSRDDDDRPASLL